MKQVIHVLLLIGLFAASCNNAGNNSDKVNGGSSAPSGTMQQGFGDSTVTDTVITNIDIDGASFFARIFRSKYDESGKPLSHEDLWEAPIQLSFFRPDTKQVVFHRKFKDENQFHVFKNGQAELSLPGQVYCNVITNAGGSGFAATLFRVNKEGQDKLKLAKAFEYGELTLFAISKNDSSILRIAGFWDFDANETHFEPHRYRIYKYVFQGDAYKQIELGMTKNKYPSDDELDSGEEGFKGIIAAIKADEPAILDSFNLSDYDFCDHPSVGE